MIIGSNCCRFVKSYFIRIWEKKIQIFISFFLFLIYRPWRPYHFITFPVIRIFAVNFLTYNLVMMESQFRRSRNGQRRVHMDSYFMHGSVWMKSPNGNRIHTLIALAIVASFSGKTQAKQSLFNSDSSLFIYFPVY